MLTETNLKELLVFQSVNPVVSVYLNTDPTQGSSDVYKSNLRSMLKDINLSGDVEVAESYFSTEYNWSGRSVALFSCAAEGFIRAYSLAIPVRNRDHRRPSLCKTAGVFVGFLWWVWGRPG
jgi:hypothetical protein